MSTSALSALQGGFTQLNKGAAEVVTATFADPTAQAQDIMDVRSGSPVDTEPMLSGMRDMMLAREQISAGAVLLHAYSENRQSLYELLKP